MNFSPTASTLYFKILFKNIEARGFNKEDFIAYYEASPNKRKSQFSRAPSEQVIKAWEKASEYTNEPFISLLAGKQTKPLDYGIMSYVWMNCSNLLQMLELVCKYKKLLNSSFSAHLVDHNDHYIYTLECADTGGAPLIEFDFASILNIGNHFSLESDKTKVGFISVDFQHSPELSTQTYYKDVFGCEVNFGKSENRIIISKEVLEANVVSKNPGIIKSMLGVVDKIFSSEVKINFSGQVSLYIQNSINKGYRPSIEQASSHFKHSVSTFKRALRKDNTKYSDICAEALLIKAEELILADELSILEISMLLNFSSSSSFHRAFRRWKGLTPGQFLTQNQVIR